MAYLVKWKTSDSDVRNGSYTIGYTCYKLGVHQLVTDSCQEAMDAFDIRREYGIEVFVAYNGKLIAYSKRDEVQLIKTRLRLVKIIQRYRANRIVENAKNRVAERMRNYNAFLDDNFVTDLDVDIDIDEIGHEVDGAEYEGGE